jgi:ribosomal protein S18 acetylase RimI-like enzyme
MTSPTANDPSVTLRQLRPDDYRPIVSLAEDWWGYPIGPFFHRIYFDHFYSTSLVAERNGAIVGFLVGLFSPSQPTVAYCHLIAVDPAQRGAGTGRRLYDAFADDARRDGRATLSAISRPSNRTSIAFHLAIGFHIHPGDAIEDGVPVHSGYNWDGAARVVLVKALA